MEYWNVDEVSEFLSGNKLGEDIVESFRVNEINGELLLLLNEDDLKELGLSSREDQKYFRRVLLKVQEEMKTVRIARRIAGHVAVHISFVLTFSCSCVPGHFSANLLLVLHVAGEVAGGQACPQ